MASLFQRDKSTISKHIKNVFELDRLCRIDGDLTSSVSFKDVIPKSLDRIKKEKPELHKRFRERGGLITELLFYYVQILGDNFGIKTSAIKAEKFDEANPYLIVFRTISKGIVRRVKICVSGLRMIRQRCSGTPMLNRTNACKMLMRYNRQGNIETVCLLSKK